MKNLNYRISLATSHWRFIKFSFERIQSTHASAIALLITVMVLMPVCSLRFGSKDVYLTEYVAICTILGIAGMVLSATILYALPVHFNLQHLKSISSYIIVEFVGQYVKRDKDGKLIEHKFLCWAQSVDTGQEYLFLSDGQKFQPVPISKAIEYLMQWEKRKTSIPSIAQIKISCRLRYLAWVLKQPITQEYRQEILTEISSLTKRQNQLMQQKMWKLLQLRQYTCELNELKKLDT